MARIIILLAGLIASTLAFGDETEVGGISHGTKIKVQTLCLDGYLFAVANVGTHYSKLYGVSIVQIYTPGDQDNVAPVPQPVMCGESNE